jgi:hypothetical protein
MRGYGSELAVGGWGAAQGCHFSPDNEQTWKIPVIFDVIVENMERQMAPEQTPPELN